MKFWRTAMFLLAVGAVCAPLSGLAWAEDRTISITIRDNKFDPAEVRIKAGEKVILAVKNTDKGAEELESEALKIEKIIPAGREAKFKIGPLKPGTYKFFGEFHEDTAQGRIVVE
jgi:plastocyanin